MSKQTAAFGAATLRTILRTYDVDYVVATTAVGALAAQGLVNVEAPDLQFRGTLKLGAVYQPVKDSGAP